MIIHVVRPGESVYRIAERYGVTAERVAADNGLSQPDKLVPGQALVLNIDAFSHTVQRGESLYSIAGTYGVTLAQMLAANPQITQPRRLQPGAVVVVPAPPSTLGEIDVNGYAYPHIDRQLLRDTLPYLTYLSLFSYQVRQDGSLIGINDVPLIDIATSGGVASLMIITNIAEDGSFSGELASAVLNDAAVRGRLLDNIVRLMGEKNYAGLGIDFEYIFPEDRDAYTAFVRQAVERLRPLGYSVSTALAPKTSAGQTGLLYEAHDYGAHGALVDHVILMTYEWGYTYGPPMAVAPLNQVRRVIDYALTVIPAQKILMGIPNYGYDWTLPYTPGSAARVVSNTGAVELAVQTGSVIRFDPVAQSPYFHYTDAAGRRHEVWFEDARSIEAKLKLVAEKQLGGVSYWTINRPFPQNWLVLSAMFDVHKIR